jgi:polysaccharide biosynthesis transport protein
MNKFDSGSGSTFAASSAGAAAADRPTMREAPPLLTQILSIIRRRKWFILGAIVGALLLGLLFTLIATPVYSASATLEIKRDSANFINVEGVEPQRQNSVDLEFYQTQYGLLRSRALAERVAGRLNLQDDPNFFATFGAREAEDWFENGRPRPSASTRDQRLHEAATILLENFYVVPERLSRLVDVRFTSPDPALSQRIINAWGQNFIESNLERRFEATSYARRFLEQRLAQLRTRIDESERRLVGYAAREGIVNIPSAAPPGGESTPTSERSLVADDLANLNRELSSATADRVRAQSRTNAGRGVVPEALTNMAITQLRQRRAELAADYARLLVQFDPQYPAAVAINTQIEQLDRSIAREETRVQDTLRQTYRDTVTREATLQNRVEELKTGVLDLRRRSIQYNIYQRDADTNRELYDALLQRYKEIGVAGGVGINNISVVDEAERPDRPASPSIPMNMMIALLAGIVVAAAGAFGMEQIDQGVTDPTEVEDALAVPLLGTIPRTQSATPIDDLQDRKSPLTEAYLSLSTNLSFSTDHGVPKSLAVTSSRPAEGKTTTSYALASALARMKRRVLLVDGDLRSPSIHGLVGARNDRGVSNYLAGGSELASLVQPAGMEGLFVLPAGPQPPSAPELLASDRLDQMLRELLTQYDHIVLDAPPVMGLADAPLIGSRVESVVFVLESHSTQKSMAKVALDRLRAANAQILGIVLTKFDAKRAHYGYGYEYGYGYGYGTEEKKPD